MCYQIGQILWFVETTEEAGSISRKKRSTTEVHKVHRGEVMSSDIHRTCLAITDSNHKIVDNIELFFWKEGAIAKANQLREEK